MQLHKGWIGTYVGNAKESSLVGGGWSKGKDGLPTASAGCQCVWDTDASGAPLYPKPNGGEPMPVDWWNVQIYSKFEARHTPRPDSVGVAVGVAAEVTERCAACVCPRQEIAYGSVQTGMVRPHTTIPASVH